MRARVVAKTRDSPGSNRSETTKSGKLAMNIRAYLDRINYSGTLAPTPGALRALQLAHLRSVPFENLSIHAGQPIILNDEALFEKIVERQRGGFCYELNGLFAALLRDLGFSVRMLSARVANADGIFGPDFDHMTLLVEMKDRWLVDVGFGDSFEEPLLLDDPGEQRQGPYQYQVIRDGEDFVLRRAEVTGEWTTQYSFSLLAHQYQDYEEMCHFQQTSPTSHFTQGRICTLATPTGRVTLSELKLITSNKGQKQERMIRDDEEYSTLLRDRFGITEPLIFGSNRV